MLYFLHGDNTAMAREKLNKLTDSLLLKKPDTSFFKVDAESFNEEQIKELLLGIGLFEQRYLVVLDSIFEKKETKDFVVEKLEELGLSKNIFIFIEKKINKTDLVGVKKHAKKIFVFEKKEIKTQKNEFNKFLITDAIGARNKKRAWIFFEEALSSGASAEEIHGIIFWQIKNILLAKKSENMSASLLNMKPFVFNKTKGFAKNFSENELEKKISELVSIYHNTRRGGTPLLISLEKFILGL